eukprot:1394243-Amphidinium_carterae.1
MDTSMLQADWLQIEQSHKDQGELQEGKDEGPWERKTLNRGCGGKWRLFVRHMASGTTGRPNLHEVGRLYKESLARDGVEE